ncbi:MAG: flavodoxin [Clostridiales bacterium]|jgi:flavodoxin|nr:flavodoxin [Clostridiales bacterium]
MKVAVRYFSRSGNTKKLADAIAKSVKVASQSIAEPFNQPVDMLFLGGSVHGFGIDSELKQFIASLSSEKVKKVVVFSTTAVVKSAYPYIKKLLDDKGISVSDQEFHCRGKFSILHKDRPNDKDCMDAAIFAKKLIRA